MKLIKINTDHYVVVDETIQPVNGYYYDSFINKIKNTNGADYEEASHCWQITHSTKRLEDYFSSAIYTNYLPISLQEVKELIGEVNVNEKAYKYAVDYRCPATNDQEYCKHDIVSAYNNGYNQALKDNKDKKYTEDDLRRAFFNGGNMKEIEEFNSSIQSFQPKTWEIELVDGKLKLL